MNTEVQLENYELSPGVATSPVSATFKLQPEHYEALKALHMSTGWKIYRQILIRFKEGFHLAAGPTNDPNVSFKLVQQACGINMAINQLVCMIEDYDRRLKAQDLEKKDKKQPAVAQ